MGTCVESNENLALDEESMPLSESKEMERAREYKRMTGLEKRQELLRKKGRVTKEENKLRMEK